LAVAPSVARIVLFFGCRNTHPSEQENAMLKPIGTAEQMYGVVQASRIIGETVENHQQEKLGKIHDLVIDAADGRLAYAVLSFGGFMGAGTKLFAMPWKAFNFSTTENKLILNVNKDKLENAPGFEKDSRWPDFADRTWGLGIHQYYGYGPYWDH
jgi:hypothetical protein